MEIESFDPVDSGKGQSQTDKDKPRCCKFPIPGRPGRIAILILREGSAAHCPSQANPNREVKNRPDNEEGLVQITGLLRVKDIVRHLFGSHPFPDKSAVCIE